MMKCHDKCMMVPLLVQNALAQEAGEVSTLMVLNGHL